MSSLQSSGWRAPVGCPDHIRFIVEKAVNSYPPEWLEEPISGEVFSSIEECQNRLIAYSLSQGFDIVVTHSTRTPNISTTFSCVHHGKETKNWRQLPRTVEKDEEGNIVGERKRNLTVVR